MLRSRSFFRRAGRDQALGQAGGQAESLFSPGAICCLRACGKNKSGRHHCGTQRQQQTNSKHISAISAFYLIPAKKREEKKTTPKQQEKFLISEYFTSKLDEGEKKEPKSFSHHKDNEKKDPVHWRREREEKEKKISFYKHKRVKFLLIPTGSFFPLTLISLLLH